MNKFKEIFDAIFLYDEDDKNSKKFNHYDAILLTIFICVWVIVGIQALYHRKYQELERQISEMTPVTTITTEFTMPCVTTSTTPKNPNPSESNTHAISLSNTVCDKQYDKCFWIGDSRTVGLSNYVDIEYLAKVGQGLNYFIQNLDYINSLRGYNIIINLGVNDLYNLNNYIETFNNMPNEFLNNNNVYIVSVNPCNYDYEYLNSDIRYFNDTLVNSLDSRYFYINSYSDLMILGFDTVDGLHYDEFTYNTIYKLIMNSIG